MERKPSVINYSLEQFALVSPEFVQDGLEGCSATVLQILMWRFSIELRRVRGNFGMVASAAIYRNYARLQLLLSLAKGAEKAKRG